MNEATKMETFRDLVRRVAAEFGESPSTTEIAHILWEHTGFPGFWDGDPETCCEAQVRAFYSGGGS